jgi:hypothetical protein
MTNMEINVKNMLNTRLRLEWKAILPSGLIFVGGISFFIWCLYLLWMGRNEGPNNKAIMYHYFYVCSKILLIIQIFFLILYIFQKRNLQDKFKRLLLILVIMGFLPALFWIAHHIVVVIKYIY